MQIYIFLTGNVWTVLLLRDYSGKLLDCKEKNVMFVSGARNKRRA